MQEKYLNLGEMEDEYFNFLIKKIGPDIKHSSFRELLTKLYRTDFTWTFREDRRRALDGVQLRYRLFSDQALLLAEKLNIHKYITGPCSVLEMMAALVERCEESIMTDSAMGDRTGQWFWGMISSLGLSDMTDDNYNEYHVECVIKKFLNHQYALNGKGGLFTVENGRDLRKEEIWTQLCWYLDSIS